MREILETGWGNWNPSAFTKGDPSGQIPPQLLRADNLSIEETGTLRLAKSAAATATLLFGESNVYSVFSTIINNIKVRFSYQDETIYTGYKGIFATSTNPSIFDTAIIPATKSGTNRCAFLNALGQVIMCSGGIQQKFDGNYNLALGIAAPATPSLSTSTLLSNSISLNNYDGGGNYTNWSTWDLSVNGVVYEFPNIQLVFGGNIITGYPVLSSYGSGNIASEYSINFKTSFAIPVDTTNFGYGSGNGQATDIFQFTLTVADPTQVSGIGLAFCMETPNSIGTPPTLALPIDYFYANILGDSNLSVNTTNPVTLANNVPTPVQIERGSFTSVGNPNWANVKSIIVTMTFIPSSPATLKTPFMTDPNFYLYSEPVGFSNLIVYGGTSGQLSGTYNYVAVAADNHNGTLYEFSPASPVVTIGATTALSNQAITITPNGGLPVNANEYWIFRQDTDGGNYYLVNIQTPGYGAILTPLHSYVDSNALTTLITNANVNPLYNLQYYRQPLPINIVDMIWFADRVIYLTPSSFLPSFQNDPGSYDSRFVYELNSAINETCLFIAKLNVGTFIVGTTVDFYQITGTFSIELDPNDPTGTIEYQDVDITPLGISDPAVSHVYTEFQGSILYVSATGIRVLANGTSTVMNDNLDLLFRGEARYGLPPINLLPNDQSNIAVASSGQRIYWSLPHLDGLNRLYVLFIGNQTNAMYLNTRSWRMITSGDQTTQFLSLCKEPDGTVIGGCFAGGINTLFAIENTFNNYQMPVQLLTQYNFGGKAVNRKDALGLRMKINTNGANATLTIYGLLKDGTIASFQAIVNTTSDQEITVDIKNQIPPAQAYALGIYCITNGFYLQYFAYIVEDRPEATNRAIQYADNFGKLGRKRIGQWSFIANPYGLFSSATIQCNIIADGSLLGNVPQLFTGVVGVDRPQTFTWINPLPNVLARDWQIELVGVGANAQIAGDVFELHKILPPVIVQETPPLTPQAIVVSDNFDIDGRKQISVWPFRANLLGTTVMAVVVVDGNTIAAQNFSYPALADYPATFNWVSPNDLFGVDWQMVITCLTGTMEFYKPLPPTIIQQCPPLTQEAISPSNNFGYRGRKRMGHWAFRANLRGSTIVVRVNVDGSPLAGTLINGAAQGDQILTWEYYPPNDVLGTDWQMEIDWVSGNTKGIEFYEFLEPQWTEKRPEQCSENLQPTSNYGTAARKRIGAIPFVVCNLNNNIQAVCRVDGIDQTPVVYQTNGNQLNEIMTLYYHPPKDLLGIDWQVKIYAQLPSNAVGIPLMEFYEVMKPIMIQEIPTRTKHAIQPSTNLGKVGPKKINVWAFQANTLGSTLNVLVTVDGVPQPTQQVANALGNLTTVETFYWYNNRDIYGVDWQIEIYPSDVTDDLVGEFEFYKFMAPEILQVFPVGCVLDQCGPLDLNKEAVVFQARFRVMGTASAQVINYTVYDADGALYSDSFNVSNVDQVYIIKFPKGVNSSICRMVITSAQVFYRHSVEFKVRITGNETDEKWVMVNANT